MGKALAGFISGFSLAIFLVSLILYLYATPHLETMKSAYELNKNVYAATHSQWFDGGLTLLNGIKTGGGLIPVVGQYTQYAGNIKELLLDVKDLSESLEGTLGLLIALASTALYLMIISFFTFILGTVFAIKPAQQNIQPTSEPIKEGNYCPKCGSENEIEAKYCAKCGKKL